MKVKFKKFGEIEFIEAEEFYASDWSVLVDNETAEDGEDYTILINASATEYACGWI